jgi:Cys-tRNA(Pro)/Cys-tRNA(Cys) deacylase
VTPAIVLAKKAGIPHDVLSYLHDPRAESYGLEAADALQVDPDSVFKTLVVDVEGVGLACAVVPVSRMLDLKAVADAVHGRRATMADVHAAERATGYIVGGISPLAQKKSLPLVLDETAILFDRIHVSAGRRGLEISLAADDLLRLTRGMLAAIARA